MSIKDKIVELAKAVDEKKKGSWGDVALRLAVVFGLIFGGKQIYKQIQIDAANKKAEIAFKQKFKALVEEATREYDKKCYNSAWKTSRNEIEKYDYTEEAKKDFSFFMAKGYCSCVYDGMIKTGLFKTDLSEFNTRDIASISRTSKAVLGSWFKAQRFLLSKEGRKLDELCSYSTYDEAVIYMKEKYE